MKPARLTWIDYAKGVAIILVLYRHVWEGLKNSGMAIQEYIGIEHANILFFSFRMPLFFIVSGAFVAGSLRKRGLTHFISTKARTILYPYFLWGFLQISIQLVLSKYVNANRTLMDYTYLFYLPRKIDQFWYLYALFNVTVLYVLVKDRLKIKPLVNVGIGVLLFAVSTIAAQQNITLGFAGDIMHYYLFFGIGDAIGKYVTNRDNYKYFESWKLLLVLLVPFVLTQAYFLKENLLYSKVNYEYVEIFQPFAFVFIALVGCSFVLCLSFYLQKTKVLNWLHFLGRHSLYIYVAHVMVLASTRVFMTRFMGIHNIPVLLVSGIVAGLFVPILIYKLALKVNMDWIFSLNKQEPAAVAISE